MPINFPNSPQINDIYSVPGGATYTWTGVRWQISAASGGGGGMGNLHAIASNIFPAHNQVYDLGHDTRRWRDLYLSGSSLVLGNIKIVAGASGLQTIDQGGNVLPIAGGGGATVTVANTVPATTTEGSLWLDSDTGDLSIFYSNNWIEVNSSTGVLISNVIPVVNESGRLWFDTDTGDVSVSVGNAWVELSPVEGSPSTVLKPLFAFNYINN